MGQDFRATAASMVGNGRGILAADESVATMNKRLEATGVAPTAEQRCAYREMLLTTPGLSDSISGIILSDDIFTAQVSDGRPFPDACREAGLLPGIKVDTGAKPLANAAGETVTEGLDDLRARLELYASAGAAFTKWRAVIQIGERLPSRRALVANAHALARYAALVQEAGLTPIVEPEVLMDGGHGLDRCEEVTQTVLHTVFEQLAEQGVVLEGTVLKPNMVLAGSDCEPRAGTHEVAAATVRTLRSTVPAAVAGVAFLSGGQGVDQATAHLAAINALGPQPWELSFSFGRALVDEALQAWRGDPQRTGAGQDALVARARANADARAV
ncbi:class I fructose-bisphosphate aldolase [Candidatus Aeolococcus gillhamiae]